MWRAHRSPNTVSAVGSVATAGQPSVGGLDADRVAAITPVEVGLVAEHDMLGSESVRQLTDEAGAALARGVRRLTIDCRAVEIVGSPFVAALVWIARETHRLGACCTIVGLRGHPLEVLELCRVLPVLIAGGVRFERASEPLGAPSL